jgi:anti-sigma B factor antagonist
MVAWGDVTVFHMKVLPILDGENIQIVGDQLFDLVDNQGMKKVVLNFEKVVFVSSAALGKLLTLHKKVQGVGGKLVLCTMPKEIAEVFEVTKLDKLFKIYPDEQTALAALQANA